MSTKLLRDTGETLYGPRWQSDLARDLEVSDRTMRRWIAGVDDPPIGIWTDLHRIVVERQASLDEIEHRLKMQSS